MLTMDVSQYLEIFIDETKEHLQSLNTQILDLEQEPDNENTINEIFRAAHSLKGMSGTMGYKRMQLLTHHMENVLSEVRNGTVKVKANLIDVLFQCLDALEEYLACIQETADEGTNENEPIIKGLNDILDENLDDKSKNPSKGETKDIESNDITFDSNEKWRNLTLGDTEKTVLSEALVQNKNVFGLTVYVQENCILKAARAFLVFKALEEIGEIIFSDPTVQDIEDEIFDLEFSLVFVTDSELDEVMAAIKNVSEIENTTGGIYDVAGIVTKQELRQEEIKMEELQQTLQQTLQQEEIAIPTNDTEETQIASEPVKQKEKKPTTSKPVVNRTVRVDIEKLDVLMNLVSELIIAKNSLVSASEADHNANSGFNEQIGYLESVTTNLHESVMKVRMVPIESVVNKFPRMIRDLSKKLGKNMELYMTGEETELDRTVVDEIGDPLMHLLRNSADHGLESNEVRKERGKPATGSIFLDAYQDGNNVIIEVRDDGNGINVEAVKNKAIERGTITPEQAENMTDKDIINLLFLPSFSTAKTVSDVSGRGVGLDVVRSKIEALSGEVEVRSKLGEGSTFTIRLPLTLAIIQALMVDVGNEKYAISLGTIQTIEDINPSDIRFVQAKEVIHLRGTVIPLIRLNEVLDVASNKKPDESMIVVIVKKGDKLAGLVVDELMGQQEIVIKSLGKYINKCKIISGATILGDGEVALILDANAMI